jgi:metal-responsive CopG/Arc/MetJ family transcriptional regulator
MVEKWSRVTTRMPNSMIEELDSRVDDGEAQNRSRLIRKAIDDYL